jgi:hypothetical protein
MKLFFNIAINVYVVSFVMLFIYIVYTNHYAFLLEFEELIINLNDLLDILIRIIIIFLSEFLAYSRFITPLYLTIVILSFLKAYLESKELNISFKEDKKSK